MTGRRGPPEDVCSGFSVILASALGKGTGRPGRRKAASAAIPPSPSPSAPRARRRTRFLGRREGGSMALRQQAAQHPGCLLVDLHALGEQITGGLVARRFSDLEHL